MGKEDAGNMLTQWTTLPTVSMPRLPARPAICVYSCAIKYLSAFPEQPESNFFKFTNTAVLMGQSNPIAKLSVAKSTRIYFLEIINSTISRKTGNIPEWWIPIPFSNRLTSDMYSGSAAYSCQFGRRRITDMHSCLIL